MGVLVLGALAIAAIAAIVLHRPALAPPVSPPDLSSKTNLVVTSALPAPVATPGSAGPAAAPPPTPAPAVDARITIRTVPPGARLQLDGREVPNPFSMTVPRSQELHQLMATARGYQRQLREIHFDKNLELVLNLVRTTRASPPVASPPSRVEVPQNPKPDRKSKINTEFEE
jgi:hypothetical protein